jgi:LAO/AO transport system kinase
MKLDEAPVRANLLSDADRQLVDGVLAGQRRSLAKAITLIESTRADHQRAQQVLTTLLPQTGNAMRVGISGVPGAGKSTFIEALGVWLIEQGKLAVLAIDPSSSSPADPRRQDAHGVLSQREAFIRPAVGRFAGRRRRKTREAMLLCEGGRLRRDHHRDGRRRPVGDGWHGRHVLPAAIAECRRRPAGDQEGHRRDRRPGGHQQGRYRQAGDRCGAQWRNALHMLRPASPNWSPPVIALSALHKEGIVDFWEQVEKYGRLKPTGEFDAKRQHQALAGCGN